MIKIGHHSRFSPSPFGHGGQKRTAQILEILDSGNTHCSFLKLNSKTTSKKNKVKALLRLTKKDLALINGMKSLKGLMTKKSEYSLLKDQFVSQCGKQDIFIWESVSPQYRSLPEAARSIGIPIVALPHNLESLVPSQKSDYTKRQSPYWFDEELDYLRQCQKVFTISREEQWLLNLYGIDAEFLPYYPPLEVEKYLLSIRREREKGTPKDILLLGTAENPPTLLGMKDRIDTLIYSSLVKSINIHIAGFWTEKLKPLVANDTRIICHGSVSTQTLSKLIACSKVAVIHQAASSGALTRVPELLIAGIPILINPLAARTYQNMDGVHIYEDDKEFYLKIDEGFKMPSIPPRPITQIDLFLQQVKALSLEGFER